MSNHPGSSRKRRRAATGFAALIGIGFGALAATGIASADPAVDAAVNTTCSYRQVTAALNGESADAANQFNNSPVAQGWVQKFLTSSPAKRQKMIQKAQEKTGVEPENMDVVTRILGTCSNY